ncbi:MAG: stage III sporulation protein AG [Paeniclostridium sordellii]|uniref:Stage III sporulation protein AG n=1 Tax=Paeniclostridium hominis TaxID=2764329 RepID=A0ABR7K497_9FIRM|nr:MULTISPECIES: stage III sporulation protein AG [Paeniclostridium]MBC6003933.1 stage III sporulation protein AG [Paeniclostridium hominis]MDU1538836.1 stage III sporulation protein AG [Paeniclostridium sordellii]MDU2592502.1 stage III sporulation protein AG [Paeniclostridium sordellii]
MFKNFKEEDKKKIYSLAALSFVCIIGLVIFSKDFEVESNKNKLTESENTKIKETQTKEEDDLESKLENILSQIEGAGEVKAMITFKAGEQIEPAFNSNSTKEETTEKDSQGGERTVTTSSENKTMITSSENKPVVLKTSEPEIKGVLVVSSGANDPIVKEKLYSAVQTALQISGHQVQIYSK